MLFINIPGCTHRQFVLQAQFIVMLADGHSIKAFYVMRGWILTVKQLSID